MTSPSVVIIGGGQAGAWAARTLRQEGYPSHIVLISEEKHAPYERPPLSKEILLGTTNPSDLTIASHEELAGLQVEVITGVRATSIDRASHRITLDNGTTVPYEKLILCTGGRARRLDFPYVDSPWVHTLRTLDDALRLKASIEQHPGAALILGGGWIGLEVAASMRTQGLPVTLIETSERLCSRSVPADVSAFLLAHHQNHDVTIKLTTHLTNVALADKGLTVELSDGTSQTYTHIIMAAGLIANDELAVQAGLTCQNGIVASRQCQSSDPDIYAAGDVAITETYFAGSSMRLESWQNAQDQGIAVAHALMEKPIDYLPVPMVWSQQFDQFIQISGLPHRGTQYATRKTNTGELRFYLNEDDQILGVIGMNAGRDIRFARQLVEKKACVASDILADTDRPLNKMLTMAVAA